MKTFITTMKKTNLRYKRFVTFYLIAALIIAFANIFVNRFTGDLSEAVVYGDMSVIFRFVVLISLITLVRVVCAALSTLYMAKFSAQAGYNLRAHFVNHFLRAPFSKVEDAGTGESLSVFTNDVPTTTRFITSTTLDFFAAVLSFLSAFVFLLSISLFYTFIAFISAVVIMGIVALISTPLQKRSTQMSEKQADFTAMVNDSLQNLSTVVAYNLEAVLETRYMSLYEKFLMSLKKFAIALTVSLMGMLLAVFGPLIVIFTVLGLAAIAGTMPLTDFVAFSLTIMIVVGGVTQVGQGIGRIMESAGRAKRFNKFTEAALEDESETVSAPLIQSPSITLNRVSFSYKQEVEAEKPKKKGGLKISFGANPQDEESLPKLEEQATHDVLDNIHPHAETEANASTEDAEKSRADNVTVVDGFKKTVALDDVSLHIAAGSKVAIVGGSGSGKSTLLKLLLGLYEPDAGEILIGDVDVKTLGKSALRNIFAYVPQDSFLFPDSIGFNISIEKDLANTKMMDAAKDAGIHEFITQLPNGYGGVLTEDSANISGGQKQRIALARAFYKDAPVILFDEATASLDPTTEAGILTTLENVNSSKTMIMIAHRMAAIDACDHIIVMDAGKIVSTGTHDDLLVSCPVYQKLYAISDEGSAAA